MSNEIVRIFLDTNMIYSHKSLSAIALKVGVNVEKLVPGEHVMFVNKAMDRLKLFAANNVIAYLALPRGRRIEPQTLAVIPAVFKAEGRIDYEKALTQTIRKKLNFGGANGQREKEKR